ncbi:MAG TPA: transposase [Usitatibacter sp.]|nr:transposase [Usitatibacter sp.]
MPQHLILRGNNRCAILEQDVERHVFLKFLCDAAVMRDCDVHAYVLMTNHVHLLVTGHCHGEVSAMMQSIGRRFARFFNLRHARTGTLFEGRFKSSLVETDRYFLTCMRYIESNPVRAGLVRHAGDWPWSSFRQNAGGSPSGLLTPHETYRGLGSEAPERAAAYLRLFEQAISLRELEVIRNSVQMDRALGADEFLARLEAELGRPVGVTEHGGRRKHQGVRMPSNLTP